MRKVSVWAFFLIFSFGFLSSAWAKADEGMWLPLFIKEKNFAKMQKMGFKLTPEELYNVNHSSIKDGVVNFGDFCTAELVSAEGLLLTNHHCGFSSIQEHSSVEHDYLKNGFWAYSKNQELPCPNLFVKFLVRMEDVTQRVLEHVNPLMDENARRLAISQAITEIQVENLDDEERFVADIESFYEGNAFFLCVYEVFRDIRLVAAPPSSIGNFGGDTDNWMWPRHTGDFSMFRIYTSPDGKPAKYNAKNIPYVAKHFFPISLKGFQENDFTMVWGFPGSTERYSSSYEISYMIKDESSTIIKAGDVLLSEMKKAMEANEHTEIAFAPTYAKMMNMYKNRKGEIESVRRLKLNEQKKLTEYRLGVWIFENDMRKQKYGDLIHLFSQYTQEISQSNVTQIRWNFWLATECSGVFNFAANILESVYTLAYDKPTANDKMYCLSEAKKAFATFNRTVDEPMYRAVLELYANSLSNSPLSKQHLDAKAKHDLSNSIFYDSIKFMNFVQKPKAKVLEKDPVYQFVFALLTSYYQAEMFSEKTQDDLQKNKRLYISALREMDSSLVAYPNANSTLRMSYGKVLSYTPFDGAFYKYYTTVDGVMEKEDPANKEFQVSAKLKALYQKKDFGRYAQNGELRTCFITNNDITGGNSGSPCLNAEGHLIGVAFDGNWESMSSDLAYEPNLQRTINCDIRYILFVIDKIGNAQNIIQELQFIE